MGRGLRKESISLDALQFLAALNGNLRPMKRLVIELSVSVAQSKLAKFADTSMRAFIFPDERMVGTPSYSPAQEN